MSASILDTGVKVVRNVGGFTVGRGSLERLPEFVDARRRAAAWSKRAPPGESTYSGRCGEVASTAAKLYVHPNTLRQRLSRIEAITGFDLEREDSLTVEMAMKLLKLEEALAALPIGAPRS